MGCREAPKRRRDARAAGRHGGVLWPESRAIAGAFPARSWVGGELLTRWSRQRSGRSRASHGGGGVGKLRGSATSGRGGPCGSDQGRDARINAALIFARAGDVARAETLSRELNEQYPLDTVLQNVALPCIRAAILLQHDKPLQALEILEMSRKYELSQGSHHLCLSGLSTR